MENTNAPRTPSEVRPPNTGPLSAAPPPGPQQGFQSQQQQQGAFQPRPPLARVDSRAAFPPAAPRPPGAATIAPAPQQQRPQFQPGGTVTNPPQFTSRPATPAPRGLAPPLVPPPQLPQGPRVQAPPPRPPGPQPFAPQQGLRPQQSPLSGAPRAPPPSNLQFGPRQPPQFGGGVTPDGSKPIVFQQPNGAPRIGAPPVSLSRQASQGTLKSPEHSNLQQSSTAVNLDNPSANTDQNVLKSDVYDIPGAPKSRSYSIAAPPGAPSPLKADDDRRKSISVVGGRIDEVSRSPGLGLIQESKVENQDNGRGLKESFRPELSDKNRDVPDRSDLRLAGSKMTDSFMGSLGPSTIKNKTDDDDDVILQNTLSSVKPYQPQSQILTDRSPSLSRDSPEPKQRPPQNPVSVNKTGSSQNGTPEPQRSKTPKSLARPEVYSEPNNQAQISDSKPPAPAHNKPTELNTPNLSDSKKSTSRKTASAPKYRTKDGDNDSGVDESTQGQELNGSPGSPNKKMPSKLPTKEKSNGSLKPSLSRSSSKSATAKTPENPLPNEKKKVPMNKVQVGNAPSPNIKAVKSKIGSLDNTTYKPGGGKVKIENKKLDFQNVTPKIAAKNDTYAPSVGTKKIPSAKLEWNAKSKIGSLQNSGYKPGGGDKKIETVKLDFKDKAKPKVASTVNITHKPGGGAIKIENQKLEFKAQSKVGSLDNVKHKPKGGDVKIFDDKDYLKQMCGTPAPVSRTESRQESPIPSAGSLPPKADVNLNQQQ